MMKMRSSPEPVVGHLQWKLMDSYGYVQTLGEAKFAIESEGDRFDFHHYGGPIKWSIGLVVDVRNTTKRSQRQMSDGSGRMRDVYEKRKMVFINNICSGHVEIDEHTEDVPRGNAQGQVR